jgi:hypothetical protein
LCGMVWLTRIITVWMSRPRMVESAPRARMKLRERVRQNNTTGKSPKVCPALRAKIFRFHRQVETPYQFPPSCPTRGALAIVANEGQGAMDAKAATDERGRRVR